LKCRRATAVKLHIPLLEKAQKADADEFLKERELIRIVGVKGGPVQGSGQGDVLDGDLVELHLLQQATKSVLKELTGPENTGIQALAVLMKHETPPGSV
ncbi:MAG TPA: hypothetical protein VGI46_10745, partial [Candidatus Acidoferrum sp.]